MDQIDIRAMSRAYLRVVATVFAVLLLASLLPGCASSPVEIAVPVPVKATPPAELLAPIGATPPTFVAPGDPAATSGLTAQGERDLKVLLLELFSRVRAWEAWGAGGGE